MKYLLVDQDDLIVACSKTYLSSKECRTIFVTNKDNNDLVGKKVVFGGRKKMSEIRLAVICNWGDKCGISTYTRFLVESLKKKVKEVKIFSEDVGEKEDGVCYCWKRGESMYEAVSKVLEWKPDFILIQHEFGLFPKATYWLSMLQMLDQVPYLVTLHSVYSHLDKTICTSNIKNIAVHSKEASDVLRNLGNQNNIYVVPHGCVKFDHVDELWNIFQNPYSLVQFGFGFFYKGVDRAIEAIHHLKSTDEKFKNIFYCYLCAESDHTSMVHSNYLNFLKHKICELGLHDNVAILRGFHSEQTINNYLRTAKIALFPYMTDPNNTVYGASGAIRIAMANKIPVVASESHLFDDLEGVVPRPNCYLSLANEIDHIFSDEKYKKELLHRNSHYVKHNTWDHAANKYLHVMDDIIDKSLSNCIFIPE